MAAGQVGRRGTHDSLERSLQPFADAIGRELDLVKRRRGLLRFDHELGGAGGAVARIRTARRAATSEGRWDLGLSLHQRVDLIVPGTSRVSASLTGDGVFAGDDLVDPDRLRWSFVGDGSIIAFERRPLVRFRVVEPSRHSVLGVTVLPEAAERGLIEASLLVLLGSYRLGVHESPA